jgi:hypothetical protein
MPYIRRLPSGLWAATVRLPSGRRPTRSHELGSVVADWAADLETDVRRGDWIDPRAAKTTVGQCWKQWGLARHLEQASRKRDASHWRCHVEPE